MEYMPTDLKQLIMSKVAFTEPQIKCILKQVLEGAKYLHSHFVIHRVCVLSEALLE